MKNITDNIDNTEIYFNKLFTKSNNLKNKKIIKLDSFNKKNNKEKNNNSEESFKLNLYNINTNFKQIFNFIFSHSDELINNIENKYVIDQINNIINRDYIVKLIRKLEVYHDENYKLYNEINNDFKLLYNIYLLIIILQFILDISINLIKQINILDERILLSETAKNNINNNKYAILEIYKNIKQNNNNNISIFMLNSLHFITLDNCNYIIYIIFNFIYNIPLVIDLYIYNIKYIIEFFNGDNQISNYIITKINLISNILETKELILNNDLDNININLFLELLLNEYDEINNTKSFIALVTMLNKRLFTKNKIKSNITSNKQFRIIENNKLYKLNQYYNFSKTILSKEYESLFNLFTELNDSLNNKLFNRSELKDSLNMVNISYKFIESYYKNMNKQLIIIILESDLDKNLGKNLNNNLNKNLNTINYTTNNLLDNKLVLEKNQGINLDYIKKTQTIVNNSENKEAIDYISNIQNIIFINDECVFNSIKNTKIGKEYLEYLMNIDILLINHNSNNKFQLLEFINHSNKQINNKFYNVFYKLYDFQNLIFNEPNYYLENYNSILESGIINNTLTNALQEYNNKINTDFKSYNNFNHIELKNNIIDDIKNIKLKINNENKSNIIDKILNIFSNNISKFIEKNNNIEFTSELYLTYLSNINNLLNKLKKELVDNYNEDLIINIDKIFNSFYNNIITIYNNIIDKLYYSKVNNV
jgi:hypothetical protein